MLVSFEHVGMTVSNIDRSLAFYVDLLGLKLVMRRPARDGHEICFLDAGGAMLELIGQTTGALAAEDIVMGRCGLSHLTFRFDSLDEIYTQLKDAGVEFVEAPRDAENLDILRKLAFCRDPDGIMIELTER